MKTNNNAEKLANFTFNLLAKCQEKEAWIAEKHGLFPSEFKCLRLIGNDSTLNNKEVAKLMHLSASRLTRIIDGLVKKGYLQREIKAEDRRNMRLTLLKRGKQLTDKLDKSYLDIRELQKLMHGYLTWNQFDYLKL